MSENKQILDEDVNFMNNFTGKCCREQNVREDKISNYSEQPQPSQVASAQRQKNAIFGIKNTPKNGVFLARQLQYLFETEAVFDV